MFTALIFALGANNFGLDRSQLAPPDRERLTLSGRPVTYAEALGRPGAPHAEDALIDDSAFLRLTVIGPADAREKVAADWNARPEFAPFRDRVLVQSYPPDHWAVKATGFVTSGAPTIYYQRPDGEVLHRQDDYSDGPEALASALRKADPNYDPAADPDRRKKSEPPVADPEKPRWHKWLAMAGAVIAGALAAFGAIANRRASGR